MAQVKMPIFDDYIKYNVYPNSFKTDIPSFILKYFNPESLHIPLKGEDSAASSLNSPDKVKDSHQNSHSENEDGHNDHLFRDERKTLDGINADFFLKYGLDHALRNLTLTNDSHIIHHLSDNNIGKTRDGEPLLGFHGIFGSDFRIIYLNPGHWPNFCNSNNASYLNLFTSLVRALNRYIISRLYNGIKNDNGHSNDETGKLLVQLNTASSNLDNSLFVNDLSRKFLKETVKYYLANFLKDEKFNFGDDTTEEEKMTIRRSIKHLREINESLPNPQNNIGFSFSPCGFFIPYHLGVLFYLCEQNIINFSTPLSGGSSGSISVFASTLLSTLIELMNHVEDLGLIFNADSPPNSELTPRDNGIVIAAKNENSPTSNNGLSDPIKNGKLNGNGNGKDGIKRWRMNSKQNLDSVIQYFFSHIMRDNSHELPNLRPAKIAIFYSIIKGLKFVSISRSEFENNQDLIDCLRSSCFIPFYSSKEFLVYRNKLAFDGQLGIVRNAGTPPTEALRTVRVNPYNLTSSAIRRQFFFNEFITPHLRTHDPYIKYYLSLKSFIFRVNLLFFKRGFVASKKARTFESDSNETDDTDLGPERLDAILKNLISKYEHLRKFYNLTNNNGKLREIINGKILRVNSRARSHSRLNPRKDQVTSKPSLMHLFFNVVYYELTLHASRSNTTIFTVINKYGRLFKKYRMILTKFIPLPNGLNNTVVISTHNLRRLRRIKLRLERDLGNILGLYGAKPIFSQPASTSPLSLFFYLNIMKDASNPKNRENFHIELNQSPSLFSPDIDKAIFSNFSSYILLRSLNGGFLIDNRPNISTTTNMSLGDVFKNGLSNSPNLSKVKNLFLFLLIMTPPPVLTYNFCNHPDLINYNFTPKECAMMSLNLEEVGVQRFLFDLGKSDAFRWLVLDSIKFENYLFTKAAILLFSTAIDLLRFVPYQSGKPNHSTNFEAESLLAHKAMQETDTTLEFVSNFLKHLNTDSFATQYTSNSSRFRLFLKVNKLVRTLALDNTIDTHFLHFLTHSHYWVYSKNYAL